MRFRKIGLKADESETTLQLLSHDDKIDSEILPVGTKILGSIWWIWEKTSVSNLITCNATRYLSFSPKHVSLDFKSESFNCIKNVS